MGLIEHIIVVYVAMFIVVLLHELGHMPERIQFFGGFLPLAAAIRARYQAGGLIVNALLFSLIFYYKPENTIVMYVGALAWIHFILYAVFGSFLPEPIEHKRTGNYFWDTNKNRKKDKNESFVDLRTFVFDDIKNDLWFVWIPAAIISYLAFSDFYVPILQDILRGFIG